MAENLRFLRALQRIADTTRRVNQNPRPRPTIQVTPSILRSLPEHRPLLPLLLSHNIPSEHARICSERYAEYASKLRSEMEAKLVSYLTDRKERRPARVYSLFLNNYSQALQLWSQSILNTALKNLKRDSVELQNLEVTYPAPLWLSLPPVQVFSHSKSNHSCPLSPMTRPTHAFPTTYPPPFRPSPGVAPVEWPRTLEASPTPPACTVDIDSLCNQFVASLTLDEKPQQPRQSKPSIFSLPVVSRKELGIDRSRPKPPKRKNTPRDKEPSVLSTGRSGPSPPKPVKHRQHSIPPFPLPSTRTKTTLRKTSAPPHVSVPRQTPESPQSSESPHHAGPTTQTYPNTLIPGGSDAYSYSTPTALLDQRLPFNSTLERTPHTPQSFSPPLTGPTTPPAFPLDPFSEPIVVPNTPVRLSPRSSLMPIADPFLQFEPQYDYFSSYLGSAFNYSTSTPGLATSDFFSKGTFDTSLGIITCVTVIQHPQGPTPC